MESGKYSMGAAGIPKRDLKILLSGAIHLASGGDDVKSQQAISYGKMKRLVQHNDAWVEDR